MTYHPNIRLPENTVSLASTKPRMDLQLQRQRTMRLNNVDLANTDVELSVDDVVFDDKPLSGPGGDPAPGGTPRAGAPRPAALRQTKSYIHGAMDTIFGSPSRREAELAGQLEALQSEMRAAERRHAREKLKLQKEQQMVLSKVKVLEGALAKLPLDKLRKLGNGGTPPPAPSAEKKHS